MAIAMVCVPLMSKWSCIGRIVLAYRWVMLLDLVQPVMESALV